jgi:hypothetical protein
MLFILVNKLLILKYGPLLSWTLLIIEHWTLLIIENY